MESALGYAGTHSSIYDAIYFLNHLESVDTKTVNVEDIVCAICQACQSDPIADQTWHQLVRLPSCGHVFGKSCLFSWLTPFDQEQVKNDDNNNDDDNDDEADNEDADNEDEHDEDDQMSEVGTAENETFLLTEPSSEFGASGWTAVNVLPTNSTNDASGEGHGNEEELSSDSVDAVMGEASADEDYEESDVQDDREKDSDYEPSSDSMDEVMEEASADADNEESDTPDDREEDSEDERGYQSKRSEWLPDKAAHIDKNVSWTGFLLEFPTSEHPNGGHEHQKARSYSLAYRSGDSDTGLETLKPGNNTCPCCRAEVFAPPARVDSLVHLATRIRVWDTAYAFLGIERTLEEKFVRRQCLEFIDTVHFHRDSQGEGISANNSRKLIRALKDARWSLVQVQKNASDGLICKPEEDRDKLHAFGKAMRYRPKDLEVWYSNDTFKVWYGPEDLPVRYTIQVEHLEKSSGHLS
ncbi:MAG: hypothetical protein LQ339_000120 [Xanthoria mediterranea]|nr:MAG: hypothetical protein LQ339_000120 [Xanthoria mediterranea]